MDRKLFFISFIVLEYGLLIVSGQGESLVYWFCIPQQTLILPTLAIMYLFTGVSLSLRGVTYLNNSVVQLSEIGEGDDALLCHTDNTGCCTLSSGRREGEWYFPGGDRVLVFSDVDRTRDFYRNRGHMLIRLNRLNNSMSPTGCYHCDIPNANDVIHTLYIYISNGE